MTKNWSQHGKEQFAANRAEIRAEYAAREVAALENENASGQAKKQLLAVLRMEQLAVEEGAVEGSEQIRGFSATVDRKGVIVFTLPGGGRILDCGKELFFSINNDDAQQVAVRYAQKKWGKSLHTEGNKIVRREKNWRKSKCENDSRIWNGDYFCFIFSATGSSSCPRVMSRAVESRKIISKLGCRVPFSRELIKLRNTSTRSLSCS